MFLLQISTCENQEQVKAICKLQSQHLSQGTITIKEVKKQTKDIIKRKCKRKLKAYKGRIYELQTQELQRQEILK